MATVCQIYDETLATVLFDLNDPTGANASDNGYSSTDLLANVDLGSPAQEFERFSPPQSDGGSTVFKRAGFRNVKLPFRMRASSYDNLAQAMGRLTTYLANGCVIRWQANNSSNVRYLDVEPSSAPYFLDGRDLSMYLATSQVDTPDGLVVELTAQPYLRGAELDSAGNLFTNATLLRDADLGGRPDGWTWSSTSNISNENIDATAEAFEFDMAVSGANRSLTNSTAAASAAVGQDWTVSGYVRVSSASMTNARAQAMLTWRTSAPADISTITSTLTALTSAWQRFSISGTAPATTDRIQGGMRFNNTSATSATIQMKNLQVEMTTTAQPFRVGTEAGIIDPEPSSGMGRVFPFYNAGDAPTPVKIKTLNSTTSRRIEVMGLATNGESGAAGAGGLTTYLNLAHYFQAEDFTNGTDTLANSSASSSPGSGTTGKKTTFATTTDTSRATLSVSTASVLSALRGRSWHVLLRLAYVDATYSGVITTRVGWGDTSNYTALTATGDAEATNSTEYNEVDMGVVTFPDVTPAALTFDLRASRTTGSGNIIWDCLTLVPTVPLTVNEPGLVTSSEYSASDPARGITYIANAAGAILRVSSSSPDGLQGPVPFVAPPGLSMFYIVSGDFASGTAQPTAGTQSFTTRRGDVLSVAFAYAPRFLT